MSQPKERRGPQFYLHLEFGLSWGHAPKNHEVTYRSHPGLPDANPPVARQTSAQNANYLSAIVDFEQRQKRARELRRAHTDQPPSNAHPHQSRPQIRQPDALRHHQMQEYYQDGYQLAYERYIANRALPPPPPLNGQPPAQRASRTNALQPSQERGRSAPPPVADNAWDGDVSAASDRESISQQAPDQWKALPADPSRFRLGEDGMPWSSWSWPMGYDPSATYQDDGGSEHARSRNSAPATSNPATSPNQPHSQVAPNATPPVTVSSTFSPGSHGPSTSSDTNVASGRERELEALSAAMMTVDNGPENQRWSGRRESVEHQDEGGRPRAGSLGWAVASPQTPTMDNAVARSLTVSSLVSPISDVTDSPEFQYLGPHLSRRPSTRSEELWFREGGRQPAS